MKKIMMVMALVMMPFSANAQMVTIGVNGLVCAFCAKAIEKTFSEKGFDKIVVNLDQKFVKFDVPKDKEFSDEQIKQTINDAGYELTGITRE